MEILHDEHSVMIGTTEVQVTAKTGLVHARWKLLIDGVEADEAAAAGDFRLRGHLGDGTEVDARIHQSLVGPTEVAIVHDGVEVSRSQGFVA